MGQRWDEPSEESTARRPALRPDRSDRRNENLPAVVEGRVTHVSARPPYPPAEGYAPQSTWGMYAPSPYGGYANVPPPEQEPPALAHPFPVWLTIAAPLVMLLTLALAFAAEVFLLGADWATGALAAALAAFALAAVTVLVLIARVVAGRRAPGMVALAGLLALTLVVVGVGGVTQLNPLRHAQAKQFEAAQRWQQAIDEYAQAGESAPNAPDIARIYTKWGEALKASNDLAGAAAKFATVTQTYAQSGASVTQARADLYTTYIAWIQTGATTLPFQQALSFLTAYASDPACDTTCQQNITNVSGQAHYQFGTQLLKASQFKQAITELELVQSKYGATQYAKPAHAAAAQAYLALAQQTLAQDCATAVPYYQALAKNYGDTNEGKQAKTKLAAPVKVSGAIAGAPKSPVITFYLSLRINTSQFFESGEYKVKVSSSGAFSFPAVKPGVYFPTALQTTSTKINYYWWTAKQGSSTPYAVTVGPLCAYQMPALSWQ